MECEAFERNAARAALTEITTRRAPTDYKNQIMGEHARVSARIAEIDRERCVCAWILGVVCAYPVGVVIGCFL
jgi:hypothetical protein